MSIEKLNSIPREAFHAEDYKDDKAFWVDKSDEPDTNRVSLRLGYDPAYGDDIKGALPRGAAEEYNDAPLELFLAYYTDLNQIEFYGYPIDKSTGERQSVQEFSLSYEPDSDEFKYFASIMDDEAKTLGYESVADMYESNETGSIDTKSSKETERDI